MWAGLQNALAGGGSFVTLPALIVFGMSPLAANITSTVALFPAQVATGWASRHMVRGAGKLPFRALFAISVVGGALGGGIGFLMMAALTMAGLSPRHATSTKNALAGVMNASAVVLFVTSPQLHWGAALALGGGAVVGGLLGTWALHRVNERMLRIAIVCIGAALTVALFVKPI
nr:TSUP family transporter [Burkholderia multivorans]